MASDVRLRALRENRGMLIDVKGVRLWVVEEGPGDGPVVVLLHGFPELGFSWRPQIPALARQGYRLSVPPLRGFGRSDAPPEVADYAITDMAQDVIGLIDHAGVE